MQNQTRIESPQNHQNKPPLKSGGDKRFWAHDTARGSKTIEVLASVILAALAGLFGTLNHPILAITSTFLSVALGLALLVNIALGFQGKPVVWLGYGIVVVLLGIGACTWSYAIWNSEPKYSGLLIPANDPLPPEYAALQASISSNDVCLSLGNNTVIVKGTNRVPVIRVSGTTLLSLEKTPDGASVDGMFFGKNGNVVTIITNNHFLINQFNQLSMARPDKSTLIVRDQQAVEVVNIRFLRPSVFRLTGTIRLPNQREITITTNFLTLPNHLTHTKMAYTVVSPVAVFSSSPPSVFQISE